MENVRLRGNSSPPPTADFDMPSDLPTPKEGKFDPEGPAWTPEPSPTMNFADNPSPQPEPLFRGFERPSFSRIAILTALCLTAYPAFYALTFVAKDRTLFAVRTIVSVWCSGIGFALGYLLLAIGAQHLEAATWASVIHMSYEGDGIKLRDLARGSGNPTSIMPAFHIFLSRFKNQETSRRSRRSYDKRPWFLFLGFSVILAILAPQLPFLFGRIVVIETFVSNQSKVYHEVLIAADTSSEDEDRAAALPSEWSAFSYGRSTAYAVEFIHGRHTVYFAQPSLSQFLPGGYGVGVFNQSASIGLKDAPNDTLPLTVTGRNAPKNSASNVLRYPQWGIRIHCEKLPDPQVNLVPSSNLTHAFVPRDFLRGLFGALDTDLREPFTKLDTKLDSLPLEDTFPSNIDPSTISLVFGVPNDGIGVNLRLALPKYSVNHEWTTVEAIFIRFRTSMTTNGSFPVYSMNTRGYELGYDAAVCIQKYEPWIIEAYNTSLAPPSILRIVEKWDGSTSLSPGGNIQGPPIAGTRYLNTSSKVHSFKAALINGGLKLVRSNEDFLRDYVPTPTAVSFTGGNDVQGYTELSPDRLGIIRARLGATTTLPYLVGSGQLVARSYADETLAYTAYKQWQLIALTILIWTLGTIGELFVPRLPLNIPRREFGLYSWLALFQSPELQFEAADDLNKLMSLEELEEQFSEKRVKFVGRRGAHNYDDV